MKLNLWRLFQPAEYIQLGRPSSLPCLAEDKSAIKRPRTESHCGQADTFSVWQNKEPRNLVRNHEEHTTIDPVSLQPSLPSYIINDLQQLLIQNAELIYMNNYLGLGMILSFKTGRHVYSFLFCNVCSLFFFFFILMRFGLKYFVLNIKCLCAAEQN